jgi:two-component system CheB/CheR fusion protein
MAKPHGKKPAPKKSSNRAEKPTANSSADKVDETARVRPNNGDDPPRHRATKAKKNAQDQQPGCKSFPIVGIGASAGGLEAFTQLLKALPTDTGMGFVVVQHLAPKHESVLTEILSRATKMHVTEVRDGMLVEPDHLYVIPPDTNMAILHGRLNLMPRIKVEGQHMPIDYFMRALAQDQGVSAIGVILSGTASDGAQGLAAIKGEGGITFAQDPQSAKYDGMPRSAIAAGVVDFILPPEGIAQELAEISRHPYVAPRVVKPPPAQLPEDALYKIFIMLRSAFGVDFTYYKHTTIRRRIMRRMVLHKIEGLDKYIKFLQSNPAELNALYQDVLITVTNFFRDAEEFEALKKQTFPNIIKNRAPDAPIRVWVPGCSTGEEAYSIAISWVEFLTEAATSTPIQIFATDVNDKAIERARVGVYPESIATDVSPERLRRFFVKVDGGYQINKSVRDMCIFARQDVTKDPPFSKMDLISCRNVLIYLGPVLQKRVIPLFHYALSASGFLLLGTSETIGAFSDLFTLIDKKHKIYAKKPTATRPTVDFVTRDYGAEKGDTGRGIGKPSEVEYGGFDIRRETDRIILNKYSPAGITINENLEILQFRGHTGPYLEPVPGVASLNLLKMVREDLAHDVRAAIQEAKKKGASVRKEGLRFRRNGEIRLVNLDVMLITPPLSKDRFFLLLFEESEPPMRPGPEQEDSGKTTAGKKKSTARV